MTLWAGACPPCPHCKASWKEPRIPCDSGQEPHPPCPHCKASWSYTGPPAFAGGWGRGRTQGQDGDVGGPVRAQQGVLPCLVERGLLVKHTLHGPHHGLEAVHAEGEGFVGLAVPVALLSREQTELLGESEGSLQPPQAVRGWSGETGTRRNQAIPLGLLSQPE